MRKWLDFAFGLVDIIYQNRHSAEVAKLKARIRTLEECREMSDEALRVSIEQLEPFDVAGREALEYARFLLRDE